MAGRTSSVVAGRLLEETSGNGWLQGHSLDAGTSGSMYTPRLRTFDTRILAGTLIILNIVLEAERIGMLNNSGRVIPAAVRRWREWVALLTSAFHSGTLDP